ncbi:RNA-directed RNA polymerase [ssRNA phage SRR6960803_9]|uniref:RNA-directed RNA polymerase n=1 Tax=ssRNA phage SRR6960803_9 TaxID=2786625 RepID=A0A8S5KZL0_9VIRU|nr:RNA-directed RNA polymerase [ssRNA phage SRR6960803_9]DAD50744.1 TPA_asm: RNA-directed RNA polymerase [ssRNA phage SRR6960803_9]
MTTKTKAFRLLSKATRKCVIPYLEGLDSARSLSVAIMLRYGDFAQAMQLDINPLDYNNEESFLADYSAVCLLSKWQRANPETSKLRRKLSIEKFWSCESHLRSIGPVFRSAVLSHDSVGSILYRARVKIQQILGPISHSFKIDSCDFGPGASTSVPAHKAHPSNKLCSSDVTSGCLPFVKWFFHDAKFEVPDLEIRESSRITVVPKNYRIDRVIAIEPDWNIFFQKGIGSAIRSRLRTFGLDLDHAASRHGELARKGSIDGSISTIDLSSASDSISTSLVRFLLPDDWFYTLNSLRTDCVEVEGKDHHLLKFSSMGNGFTFELESLIFYAISLSLEETAEESVSVFGDDIIVPTRLADTLIKVLTVCGFRINPKKSFSSGYFRESCGYHFFKGRDVKPVYLKDDLRNDFEKFKWCNSIRTSSYRFYGDRYDRTPMLRAYRTCKHLIRRVYYIPEGYGDGGLVSSFDEATPGTVRRKGRNIRRYSNCIEGYKVRCLLPVTVESENDSHWMLMHKLRYYSRLRFSSLEYNIFGSGNEVMPQTGNTFSTRTRVVRMRIGFMHVPKWVDPEVV